MSDHRKCSKPGCGALSILGKACLDRDCPQTWVHYTAHNAEIDRLTRELADATKDRDYWKVEAEGEAAKVAFRDKMTGDPDAIADRVVNAIHAEFNINLIGKADNQRLRSAVARALKEKP